MEDQPDEPRHWKDNHPWLLVRCKSTDDDGDLRLPGQKLEIRWVFQSEKYKEHEPITCPTYFCGLAYDRAGNFYGVVESEEGAQALLHKLHGKDALTWFALHASWDEAFTRELCRAIDNPQFEFLALVPQSAVPKRQRKARQRAEAFHTQLHMATALVDCLRKLDAEPSLENLADACRQASAVHTAIHAPENFKLAAGI